MRNSFNIWDFGKDTGKKRTLTSADKKRIAANQGWKCKKCGNPLQARHHIDHIKEFSKGGSDKEDNLQALCPNCHAEKPEEERYRNKKRKKSGQYWVNPLTGRKEKYNPLFKP